MQVIGHRFVWVCVYVLILRNLSDWPEEIQLNSDTRNLLFIGFCLRLQPMIIIIINQCVNYFQFNNFADWDEKSMNLSIY